MHNFTSNSTIISVRKSCEVQKRTLFHTLKQQNTIHHIFDFYFLYDESYYGDKRVNTYLDPKKAIDALRYYYAWWHKGFGIRRDSAEEVDNMRTGVFFDALNTRDKNASDLFLVLFRCFFYSLQKVSTFPVGSRSYLYVKNILRKIITSSPFMLPDSALLIFGFAFSCKIYAQNYGDISREMIGNMRPVCCYYLCKHCGLKLPIQTHILN